MTARLHLGIYAYLDSTLLADYSHIAEDVEFSNDEHGFASISFFVPLHQPEAFYMFDRVGLPFIRVTDNGAIVWEGRLEDPHLTPAGVKFSALGYYRALSDLPHTAAYSAVTANTIVTDLLTSAPLLSTSVALIQNPGVTLSESYDDKYPSEILDRLTRLGDNQTPPRVWEACVWENKVLTFQPRGASGRSWYVDISDYDIERTLQMLYNSAYGIYNDANNQRAVTATSVDQASINRWGFTRRKAVKAQTRSATVAANVRDTAIEDGREPAPRAAIEFDELFDGAGAKWPKWSARSGDTITIRNLPPTLSVALNRVRTFRILQVTYNASTNKLKVTPEAPLATLEEQMSGGPSGAASQHSSPIRKIADEVDSIWQQINGGPGGGGGGSGGGSYLIPPGAIVLFAAACPTGWTEYIAARGRALVGVPSGGTLEGTVGTALTNLGTRTISTVASHLHAAGTLAADNESTHTHADGTLVNSSELAHTHDVNPANTTSAAGTSHNHAVNPPQTTSAGGNTFHTHSGTTNSDSHAHDIQVFTTTGSALVTPAVGTATAGGTNSGAIQNDAHTHGFTSGNDSVAHDHTVDIASFNSGLESVHTHDVNIANTTSTGGTAHTHTITGSTAAGTAHSHTISGSTASTGTATVDVTMPYIQLRLCQKD